MELLTATWRLFFDLSIVKKLFLWLLIKSSYYSCLMDHPEMIRWCPHSRVMCNEFEPKALLRIFKRGAIQILRYPNCQSFQIFVQLLTLRADDCRMLAKWDIMVN